MARRRRPRWSRCRHEPDHHRQEGRGQVSRWSRPGKIESAAELNVTGTVFPDISREVPVISLANGRVVDIKARLDDNVKKGQLLLQACKAPTSPTPSTPI